MEHSPRYDMIGHKLNLSKLKIEMIPNIFPDHSALKLEINNNRKAG